MTDPSFLRAYGPRRCAALAAAGVLAAATSTAFIVAPANASPSDAPCTARFGATAAAELLAVNHLDIRPLGVPLPPVAQVEVATVHTGMAGGGDTVRAAAEGHYLQARLLGSKGPADALDVHVYRAAPPPVSQPHAAPMKGINLGTVRLGSGGLSAQASWRDAGRCDADNGPRANAEATLSGADVLSVDDERSLARFTGLASATKTQVITHRGRPAAEATAQADVGQITVFAGTASAVPVKVVKRAALRVVAGGSGRSTVEYAAPVVEVKLPGRGPVRLDGADAPMDVVVPVNAASAGLADQFARKEGLPLLSGDPLGTLLGDLAPGALAAGESKAFKVNGGLGLPAVPGLPVLGWPAAALLGGATGYSAAGSAVQGGVAVLRFSVGDLIKETNAEGVHAKAITLRVQVLSRTKWKSGADIADLGFGLLEAAAAAPTVGLPNPDGGYGEGEGETGGGQGNAARGAPEPAGGLPVTGHPAAILTGAGILLAIAGRFFMVLSRRRTRASIVE